MTSPSRTIKELEALKLSEQPVLDVVVREREPYHVDRQWGTFDELNLRAIDDIWFPESAQERVLVLSGAEAQLPDSFYVVSIPTPVALERAFFHIQEISTVVINPSAEPSGVSELQAGAASAPSAVAQPINAPHEKASPSMACGHEVTRFM